MRPVGVTATAPTASPSLSRFSSARFAKSGSSRPPLFYILAFIPSSVYTHPPLAPKPPNPLPLPVLPPNPGLNPPPLSPAPLPRPAAIGQNEYIIPGGSASYHRILTVLDCMFINGFISTDRYVRGLYQIWLTVA